MAQSNTEFYVENEITQRNLKCTYAVHTALGPGLLESAYENCLHYELMENGLRIEKQKGLPLVYKAVMMDVGYRVDLIVKDKIVIEVKSVDVLSDVHVAQVLTYLKLTNLRFGLLMNLNVKSLKDGIRRLANTHSA